MNEKMNICDTQRSLMTFKRTISIAQTGERPNQTK